MRWLWFLIAVILVGAGYYFWQNKSMDNSLKLRLTASDGVKIAYDYYKPDSSASGPDKFFVLVHMMPATKESWKEFAELAKAKGHVSIAIDLRGHGQSEGGPDGYKNFSDAEHQASIKDVEAAVKFVLDKGAKPEKITLAGASIGANLVLQYLAEHPEIKKAVLFSPGLDYRGIKGDDLMKKLSEGQRVWLVAADDDNNGLNSQWVRELYDLVPNNVERRGVTFKVGGHGTDIFKTIPELMEKFIGF